MKKSIILCACLLGAVSSYGQTIADGLLYGQQGSYGTARYRSMSGAFGALGGDLTAIGSNPAGSVIFTNHYASVSLGYTGNQTESSFNSTFAEDNDNDFTLNQAGAVLVYKNQNENAAVTKFSFGLNYDDTRNYDNNLFIAGSNNISISEYFLSFANGVELDNFQLRPDETVSGLYRFLGEDQGFGTQQGFLGYQSFVIDAVDNNDEFNTAYISNTGSGTFEQQLSQNSSGYQSKLSFNGALVIKNKLSLGLNINTHYIDYQRSTSFSEQNNNGALVDAVRFNNYLDVQASGISLQVGAIAKLTDAIRVGAAYESPTWYDVEESITQSVSARRADGSGGTITEIIDPNVVNVFAPYDLRTPGSISGSFAYIFGKKGLISLDYSSKNYSNLKFKPSSDPLFAENNQQITEELTNAGTLRIGGEYRVSNWSLRAGYRNEQSPYKNKDIMDDLTGYSLGLGYTWGQTTLDISYDRAERDYSQQLFESGLTSSAAINNVQNNIIATIGFNF
ncbi:hemin receptor [Nonlabens arenilitoris]|uniref:Hemin receptor n=1 Tax=Nonlabens arenilitoris TaxID=1217969 RepID=A0A2S7UAQ0_9FLAO|nr:outer membrane protein transport protein [Nonlabens arenilitoris]PQJ32008.1 hemin receptor [Nonlabens arenilitoris]